MKFFEFLGDRLSGLTKSITRYPFTVAFLIAAAVMTAIQIESENNVREFILACGVGAAACAAGQAAFERFFRSTITRILLMLLGCVIAVLHYLLIFHVDYYNPEILIRSVVAIFTFLIAYIWLAVAKSEVSFNESFMAAFKSIFQTAFFAAVIMAGCSAIIAAIDRLIVPIDSEAYSHTANIVFVLFAPILFLSLIPVYPGKKDRGNVAEIERQKELISRRSYCPKFLEVLLSYIIIPLASVFTVILLLYIALNIRNDFWEDNLLEAMLIAYSVTIIVVTVLVSRLENRFAVLFRRVLPKVLIPIVLFQLASSLIVLKDAGVVYSRYYVIIYGVFALCSGVALSVLAIRKSGMVALLLVILSLISLTPPIDAFTVSHRSQVNLAERVLIENGMLTAGRVTPDGKISQGDKTKIVSSIQYLRRMEELDEVPWLPDDFDPYEDFYDTFGFHEYEVPDTDYFGLYLILDEKEAIPVTGFDYLAHASISCPVYYEDSNICVIETGGATYSLDIKENGNGCDIIMTEETGQEVVSFDSSQIFSRYEAYSSDKSTITAEEATFFAQGSSATLTVVVKNASLNSSDGDWYYNAQVYVFVNFE